MRLRPAFVAATILALVTAAGANAAVGGIGNPKMSISGRVTSADGTGIAGMCVTAYRNEPNGPTPAEVGTATSNSLGYYRVTWSEPTGETAPYFVGATADCGAGGWWQPTGNPNTVTLTAGPGRNTASGVNMTALPAGRVVGRITDNANGAGVKDATVAVVDGSGSLFGEATTDASGNYIAGGMAPGRYTVWAAPLNWGYDVPQTYLASYAHHQPTVATAQFFDVVAGQNTQMSESLLHTGHIDGQVTDGLTGLPLRNVEVDAYALSGAWATTADDYTGPQGKFSLSVGPGTYAVCFRSFGNVEPTHQSRCYKNKPWQSNEGPFTNTTHVSVDGFGTVVKNINQALPLNRNQS